MAAARNPYAAGNDGPASRYAAVTLSDTVDFPGGVARSFYVGVSGNVVVVDVNDNVVTFLNMEVGYHPIICKRINATSTTATNIVALFD